MSNQTIHVIITGGTIDSEWDPAADTAVTASESVIPEYFSKLKLDVDFTYNTVFMKDSRKITLEDIQAISNAVENSPSSKILITHGTYTMPDTARYIQARTGGGLDQKSVVLTGAMIPLEGYSMSDAPFNLGFSIATLLSMEPGILLCMHGHLFTPDEVVKNMASAHFFSIQQ
ncbi:MAG TPA: asparaginase domain-containing protein [Candidatus Dormibacteraeota bacterium]|nr:asparaginase domain-containing protein [Candidatus Dormibacteraeota bacterium]